MATSRSAEIFAGSYSSPEHLWLAVHFSPSRSSQAAGLAFLERKLSRNDRDREVSEEAAASQREAIGKYVAQVEGVFGPTLIVLGSNDVIVPTVNSPAERAADPLPGCQSRIVLPVPGAVRVAS